MRTSDKILVQDTLLTPSSEHELNKFTKLIFIPLTAADSGH